MEFLIGQEDDLEELLMIYARRGFPFSDEQLCGLAYELAVKTHRPGFSPTKKKAGRAWRKGFMQRKPRLRKKNAQNLSAARAIAANPVQVEHFFQLLKQWVRTWEIEFKPNHVWNVDETGITDVPKERKVIGITGERVFQTVCDEKGTTTTVVSFVSAGGLHVPPMVIFKAGRVKDIWREAAPSGYTVKCSESGYINADLFAEYGNRFIAFLKEKHLLGNGQKHMLLLDLHSSHLFNAKFMRAMLENNIEVCSFPPHCTHVLQPLDDVPFAVLKAKYQKELLSHNFSVAGAKTNPMQLFRVLVPAFTQAFTPENIRKGFKQTGIYPIDPTVEKLKDLGPSTVTDKCKSQVVCYAVGSLLCVYFRSVVGILFSLLGRSSGKRVKRVKRVRFYNPFLTGFYLFFQILSRMTRLVPRQKAMRMNRSSLSLRRSSREGLQVVTRL